MKTGRPPKTTDELDRDIIPVKLSFNQIKHILFQYRYFQISSMEGQITEKLMEALKKHLQKKADDGKLPQQLLEINDNEDTDE